MAATDKTAKPIPYMVVKGHARRGRTSAAILGTETGPKRGHVKHPVHVAPRASVGSTAVCPPTSPASTLALVDPQSDRVLRGLEALGDALSQVWNCLEPRSNVALRLVSWTLCRSAWRPGNAMRRPRWKKQAPPLWNPERCPLSELRYDVSYGSMLDDGRLGATMEKLRHCKTLRQLNVMQLHIRPLDLGPLLQLTQLRCLRVSVEYSMQEEEPLNLGQLHALSCSRNWILACPCNLVTCVWVHRCGS